MFAVIESLSLFLIILNHIRRLFVYSTRDIFCLLYDHAGDLTSSGEFTQGDLEKSRGLPVSPQVWNNEISAEYPLPSFPPLF